MPESKKTEFVDRESRVRQIALRVTTALSVLLTSLLFFLVVPFLPRELMVLLSLGLGALAYKAPTPALALLLVLGLPGYFYQLDSSLPPDTGLTISLVVIMFISLLIVWVLASEKGEPLGAVVGGAAVILMLTPFYYLALPLMIGIALFRRQGLKTRAASLILTFIILYYPLLAVNMAPGIGDLVPVFQPVLLQSQPPIPVMSLNEILTHLGQIIDTSNNINSIAYLANLADYWPLSPNHRLIPGGILFFMLAGAAITAAAVTLFIFRAFEKREVGHGYLPYTAKASSLIVGVLTFILLASVLAQPLNIINTFSVPVLLLGTVIVGALWTLAEIGLRRRDYVLHMHHHLTEQAGEIRTLTDFLLNRISQTQSACQRMDMSVEAALGQICLQELTFIDQAVAEMSLNDMEQKTALFQDLHGKLEAAIQESQTKICHYYDEERQKYNDYLLLSQKYGFPLGEGLTGPEFSQLTLTPYEEVLRLQISLNGLCKSAAHSLSGNMEKLEATLSSQVDPDFQRTGIHIARDYFARECYADALQEFLLELGDIEHILQNGLAGLDQQVLSTSHRLKVTLADVLMPTAVNMGDITGVNHYQEALDKIASLSISIIENATLPDLLHTVSKVSELGEIMADLGLKLDEKLLALEKNIQDKTPPGYSWGVDPGIRDRIFEISRSFRKSVYPVNIHDRLSLLNTGPSAIDSASLAIKDYSIAHELLINYSNIEHLLEEKLQEMGSISITDLPVKRPYARHYLKLYCLKHPGKVHIEADTGRLAVTFRDQEVSQDVSQE